MSNDLRELFQAKRILIEASLTPVQGSRFQPTGFPNLGAAEFRGPSGTQMILVESAQSMANRLEQTAWDDVAEDLVAPLRGVPYVSTTVNGRITDSIREAHRINSPFLYPGIKETLATMAEVSTKKKKGDDAKNEESSGIDIRKLAKAVFHLDPNSILHGIFLEKLVGAARLSRALSAFIEAKDVAPAESGGVKNDRIDPTGKQFGGAAKGFGNVPFARTEYTAQQITAYFSIDIALIRSYGLGADADELLIAIALWKIQQFLANGGRLRTACDFDASVVRVTRPEGWQLPTIAVLETIIARSVTACSQAGIIAAPAKTVVVFEPAK